MVYRNSTCGITTIIQLIRWIAYNDVELHLEILLWLCGVDELVGVAFKLVASVVLLLGRAAELALAVHPSVLDWLEPDVAVDCVEVSHGVVSVRGLRAVDAAT